MHRFRVWDLPTRLFHWLLVLCVFGSFISAKIGGNAMVWHGSFGLVGRRDCWSVRLVWGFVGSTYARFFQFVRGPGPSLPTCAANGTARDTIRWARCRSWPAWHAAAAGGHRHCSPTTTSPSRVRFTRWLARMLSDRLVGIHRLIEPLIILLVLAHLGGDRLLRPRFKKETLIMPMITGMKKSALARRRKGGGIAAFCVALAVGLGAVYGASGAGCRFRHR
jgi:cytochrome b